jgi:hypothetical protein
MSALFHGRWFIAFILLAVGACDSPPQLASVSPSNPAGQYEIKGETVSKNRAYAGELQIEQNGPGFNLAWRLDQGDAYRGAAMAADNVLGAVYWTADRSSRDFGIVVYQIDGGELKGIWMPAGAKITAAGREDLEGSPDLDGRYEVTLGWNPDRRSTYSGHVEIDRNAETYDVRWFLPDLVFVGKGVRVGDVLVVGYSARTAPGVIAYCMTEDGGQGIWSHGSAGGLGSEVIARNGKTIAEIAASQAGCAVLGTQASRN